MILAICGPINSGKTTLAQALVTNYGFTRFSFASILKAMCQTLLIEQGATLEEAQRYTNGDLKEYPCVYLNGRTMRHAMQTLGTEWGRELISPNLWSNALMRKISSTPRAVIDDLRFWSEEDVLRTKEEALIIKIARDGTGPGSHASEQEYLKINADVEIENPFPVIPSNLSPIEFQIEINSFLDAFLTSWEKTYDLSFQDWLDFYAPFLTDGTSTSLHHFSV